MVRVTDGVRSWSSICLARTADWSCCLRARRAVLRSSSERCACAASRRREVCTAIIPPPRCPVAPPPLRMKAPNSPTLMWPEPSLSSATHTALRAASGSSLGVSCSSWRTRPSNSTYATLPEPSSSMCLNSLNHESCLRSPPADSEPIWRMRMVSSAATSRTASALALGTSTSTGGFKRSASGDGVEALFLSCTARSALSDLATVNSRFSLYSRRLASVSCSRASRRLPSGSDRACCKRSGLVVATGGRVE